MVLNPGSSSPGPAVPQSPSALIPTTTLIAAPVYRANRRFAANLRSKNCSAALQRLRPISNWGLEQSLADEFALPDAGGASKQTAAGVGGELVECVQFRHGAVNLDEARPRIALVGDEQEP